MATQLRGTAGNMSMEDFSANLKTIQSMPNGGAGTYTYAGSPNVNTVIPITALGNTPPVNPVNPTGVNTRNLGNNVDSTLAGVNATISTAPVEDPATKAVKDSMNTYLGTDGQEDITVAKEEEIAKKNSAVKLQNEMTMLDKKYREDVKKIEENTQGKLQSGVNYELNRLQNEYEDTRANKAISYNMAIADYNSAQETVALKTQAYTDKKDAEYRAWEMNYKMASEFMTPEQKAQAELVKAKKLQDIQDLSSAKNAVMTNLLNNNAPQSVWNAVDAEASKPGATVASILSAGGRYAQSGGEYKELPDGRAVMLDAQGNILKVISGGKGSNVNLAGLTPEQQADPFIATMLASQGGKPMTDTFMQSLNKGLTVLSQLGVLQENVKDLSTGPIVGLFKGKNPWDTNAQTIKAQLNAIVPNLARGVYGEVGVLTDNDIKTYAATLPNLTSTEDVRNAVLGITVDLIGKSIKRTLEVNAANGKDVSGFVDLYTEMLATRDSIFAQLPQKSNVELTKEDNDIANSVLGDINSAVSSGGSWWDDLKKGLGF